jgi:hypothetical protein
MSDAITMRRPLCAEDPSEVWAIVAALLADRFPKFGKRG